MPVHNAYYLKTDADECFVGYRIEGLKENGVDVVPVSDNIIAGAASSIDQNGRLNSGSVTEIVTITAKLGVLTASQRRHKYNQ